MALKTFTANASTNQLTCSAHGFALLDLVQVFAVDAGVLPAPLVEGAIYNVNKVDANTIALGAHPAAANYATTIDLTSAGSGTLVLRKMPA